MSKNKKSKLPRGVDYTKSIYPESLPYGQTTVEGQGMAEGPTVKPGRVRKARWRVHNKIVPLAFESGGNFLQIYLRVMLSRVSAEK